MDNNSATWLPWDNHSHTNDSLHWKNHTDTTDLIYVFTPAGDAAKRVLCLILSTVGGIGFLGNFFILYYLLQKPTRNPIQSSTFARNLKLYLKSLSLSGLLSCAVSVPLVCVQMFFDVFQTGWPCKVVRFLNFIFPAITINNLVVISLKKYLSTRSVQHAFSYLQIRKIIVCAWVLGLVMLFPAAAFDGTRLYLNNTHYTVVCKNQDGFYPFKISLIIFPLQYIIPSVLVTYINICLMKTVWSRGRRQIANSAINNTFKAHLRAKKIRGTTLLIALTFAFIIPFWLHMANTAYTKIAKPQRTFSTDFIIRVSAAIAVYLSHTINFIIYFAQMKEFREFLKKRLCKKNRQDIQPNHIETARRIANCRAYATQHVLEKEDNAIELRQFKTIHPL